MNTYSDSFGNRWTTEQINRKSDIAAKELIQEQYEEYSYNFCQECNRNASGMYLDVSHHISRKEAKENGCVELIWAKSNMKILCRVCHQQKDGLDIKWNK